MEQLLVPNLYRPLIFVLIFFFISHNVSLLGARPFLVPIFKQIGMPMKPHWVLVISGGLGIVGSLIGIISMKVLGKRKTALTSLVVCSICCYLLGVSDYYKITVSWIPFGLFCMLFFAAGFGVIPLPWAMLSEVFPLEGRGIAGGVSAAVSYLIGFVVTKSFINLTSWFNFYGTYIVYGTVGVIGWLYLYRSMPETEGKTLQDIEEYFKYEKDKKQTHPEKNGVI